MTRRTVEGKVPRQSRSCFKPATNGSGSMSRNSNSLLLSSAASPLPKSVSIEYHQTLKLPVEYGSLSSAFPAARAVLQMAKR